MYKEVQENSHTDGQRIILGRLESCFVSAEKSEVGEK